MKTLKYLAPVILLLLVNIAKADTNTQLNKLLAKYLDIKNALTGDDSKLANQKAIEFSAALKEVSTATMDAKQKETWAKYSEKLRFDGEHIGESTVIGHQREHFASLSKSMYAVIKDFKNNTSAVYMEYCPMKKESWLSESQTIKNPYYGKMMPDCGKVTETLKGSAN